jgi:hypothetical protein
MLSFHAMEMKFGAAVAYHCLAEIEKTANIPSWQMAAIDPETRLANAIRIQDELGATGACAAA